MAELRQQPCVSLGCCKSHTGWVLLSIRNPFCTVLEADSLSGCWRGQVRLRAPLLTAASLYTPFWAGDMLESLWRKCAWILFLHLCPHCFLTIHRQCHHLGDEDFHIWILSAHSVHCKSHLPRLLKTLPTCGLRLYELSSSTEKPSYYFTCQKKKTPKLRLLIV